MLLIDSLGVKKAKVTIIVGSSSHQQAESTPKTWSAGWPRYLLWLMGCPKSDTVQVWKSDKKPVSTV